MAALDPRPVAPMTMAEARRMVGDLDFARRFDPVTRMIAWNMLTAARNGRRFRAVIIIPANNPPQDAA